MENTLLATYHQIAQDINLWRQHLHPDERNDLYFTTMTIDEKVNMFTEAFGPDQVLAIDEVDADFETGQWLSAPRYSGNTVHRIDWNAMQDFDDRAFSTYECDGETRAIILNWKN